MSGAPLSSDRYSNLSKEKLIRKLQEAQALLDKQKSQAVKQEDQQHLHVVAYSYLCLSKLLKRLVYI
ncbi:unnamed protein product [Symbiodinium natans]|uniref:Uncharacterized protein n=1 Tax=Symbiodinium natans TaxID=878477 RepID=A0A812P1H0_9DINO|nr:unnamed protein product [Symbiodinium natans]